MDTDGDTFKHSFISDTYMVSQDELDCSDNSDDSTDGVLKSCKPLREQDRFLPIANVAKIMKKAIPENGKIAKDARECVQECVSEFISFITSEASDRCHLEKRKTINGEDILYAMCSLGFDNYVEPLKLYLQKYRETTKLEKNISGSECGYEELSDDFNGSQQNQKKGIVLEESTGTGDTVLYYQSDQLPQFQL